MHRSCRSIVLLAALLLAVPPTVSRAQSVDPATLSALSFRHLGPSGNRAIAVVGEPGNPAVAYVGAASGGIWKTENGGVDWRPVFDDFDVQSVGSLALAPTAPNEVWAGTGETFLIRPAVAMGNGIYKSTDAGRTWRHMGLELTGRIGRVEVHPRNHDIVFACALGHAYGPQQERGVYRTTDGGKTWEQVLFVDEDTGCADLDIDPNDPDVLFAGMWSLEIKPWKLGSGGTGGGVYVSRDGGDTWTKLGGGLPAADHAVGKVSVAVAPSDPDRVYALIEDDHPSLYRSDDGGRRWRLVNRNHDMAERASYYTRIAVDPSDPDRIYFASVRFGMSRDGGETLASDPPRGGGDTHDVWIDPTNAKRFMVADDGGATLTLDHGESFLRIALPIAQMYHVHTDNEIPYNVYGNRQDGYSYKGPSNTVAGGISDGDWIGVGGCESGFAVPDTVHGNIVWSGCYDGGLEVYDPATGHVRNVRVWPEASYGWTPKDVRFRWHWTFPIALSPHDPGVVFVGSQYVHRTDDGGQSWEIISPDLTLDDEARQQDSGGKTVDNLYTFDGSVLYAIAESPVQAGVIWAGSNDGQIHVTRDGGESWTNVSANLAGLPPDGQFSNIEPSHYAAGTAYAAVDRHQLADFQPYVYKTTDFGESWQRVDAGIERSVFSFVHVVREDPVREGMLFAGTDNGVWATLDDGAHWFALQGGMPHAPVYWLTVQPHFNDLVVATYGRGIWVMDDITPLRALDAPTLAEDLHLFDPRPAYRFADRTGRYSTATSQVQGRNPSYGADLDWWMAGGGGGRATVEILDASGTVVRSLRGPAQAGMNRLTWDLRHEPPTRPQLRTPPPEMPWIQMGPDGTRRLRTWDLDLTGGQVGPRAVPGDYTVRLTVGDQTRETTLTVLKDPDSSGTVADIRAQVDELLEMRDELDRTATMINRLEWIREQIEDVQARFADEDDGDEVVAAAGEFRTKLLDVEGRLFDLALSGAREDAFRNPMRLYGRLSALASDLSANGSDFPPTDQQVEVHGILQGRLQEATTDMQTLLSTDLAALNAVLRDRALPPIISDR